MLSDSDRPFLSPMEVLEVEFSRSTQVPAFPLQFSEEFIDDDRAQMSFYTSGENAYAFPYGETDGRGVYGRSETSSLVNNRSELSSLENLGVVEGLSEASSMLNFPPCSTRSEASSAAQFGDLAEQLSSLTAGGTEESGDSESETDWGSDADVLSDKHFPYCDLFMEGADMQEFLLDCRNLRMYGLGGAPPPPNLHPA